MGGPIRRGRIWRFWGAPLFNPEAPKYLFLKGFGTSGRKIGAPQKKPNSTMTDLSPHLRPSEDFHISWIQGVLVLYQAGSPTYRNQIH